MRKNRKFMAAGILTITALAGISLYAYADIREERTLPRTVGISAETSETSEATKCGSGISAGEAREAAISSAVSEYGIEESSVRDLEAEREYEDGKAVWEVSFEAGNQNNRYCEFEYLVSCEDGTVTHHHMEYEDMDD